MINFLPQKNVNGQWSMVNGQVKQGFTLIELLVVIGILTILLAIVLIAVNPSKQFAQANNTQRRSDVNAILNAIHQYAADNKGALPSSGGAITTTVKTICLTGAPITCPANSINLCTDLAPKYLADLPKDPTPTVGVTNPATSGPCSATSYNAGYTVVSTGAAAANRLTVAAPSAEDEGGTTPTISITR